MKLDIGTWIKGMLLGYGLKLKPRIDFAIIGFPKSGTTSLHKTLELVEDVFLYPNEVQVKQIVKGEIDLKSKMSLLGIKNPNLIYEPHNLYALVRANSEIKFILCLRKPSEWLFSFYQYRKLELKRQRVWLNKDQRSEEIARYSFEDIVLKDKSMLGVSKANGYYVNFIRSLLKIISKEQIHIIFLEDLKTDSGRVLYKLLNFLGKDLKCAGREVKANVNNSLYEHKDLYHDEFEYLDAHYKEWNAHLDELLDKTWGLKKPKW